VLVFVEADDPNLSPELSISDLALATVSPERSGIDTIPFDPNLEIAGSMLGR
tara:strand:- start:7270 stop:7425 length:156 start_codon:yes stop_codon:yes gene_type:complete